LLTHSQPAAQAWPHALQFELTSEISVQNPPQTAGSMFETQVQVPAVHSHAGPVIGKAAYGAGHAWPQPPQL
jgi:hypothetical protein